MKRFLTACAVAILALGVLGGCSQGNNSVQTATGATIISLSPTVIVFGGPQFTLTVFGSTFNGFSSKTVVQWNGSNLKTTFVDVSTVMAVVPASLIAKPGTAYVNVFAPQSGTGMNGLSNSLAFIVAGAPNPVPVLTSISPTNAAVCTKNCANMTITLTGTNFLPASTNGSSSVTYTGVATLGVQTAINTTNITSTQIKAVIPGSYLAAADPNAQIDVINPPSAPCILASCPELGGGATNNAPKTTQTFTVGGSGQAAATSTTAATAVAEETPAISQDGRYVAFSSAQNSVNQILLRDTCVGATNDCSPSTKIVSAALEGTAGNADSHSPVISSDGRFVAFSSAATNLLENSPKGRQVYIHDTCIGATADCKPSLALISTDPEGALNGTEAILPSISSSGRFVAFVAITPDPNTKLAATESAAQGSTSSSTSPNSGLRQVFLRDTCFNAPNCTPKTTRISLQPGDAPANSTKPAGPALSGLAKQIALANEKSATVFTHTVPVDDSVFLALPAEPK
ncbi:MAG TPA: IPT/TIG domain-containing protein [Candidatus Acidoferrum sp.]